ncbi:MAG TPA: TA system VapC family ribonuclease toxin [Polyangia bacterium]|nr:TA system VapC family ribonuclease toxin [Polyangia bacterium]
MVAVDTNLLVYSHRRETPEHGAAVALMRRLSAGNDAWAIPWPCVYEFFSVVTNPKIWKAVASPPEQAWLQIAAWLAAPSVRLLHETEEFAGLLAGFVRRDRVRGGIVHDARIAAICVAHGVETLLTRDRDFSLFPELVTSNPL